MIERNTTTLKRICLTLVTSLLVTFFAIGQDKEKFAGVDSTGKKTITVDTAKNKVKVYSPKKAALYSAILPGSGQIYNKKYWKVPIVYGALGTSAGIFFYNYNNYKDTRFAYQAKYKASQPGATAADSADYYLVKPKLQRLSMESLKFYRNEFRRDMDYSLLFFIILWGLNVVDAAVDAHLKAFDVSPDLSLLIKPGHSKMAGTNGISLVLVMR
jgi:hypothetical protein